MRMIGECRMAVLSGSKWLASTRLILKLNLDHLIYIHPVTSLPRTTLDNPTTDVRSRRGAARTRRG